MGRASHIESCMFCAPGDPCDAHAPKEKKKPGRKPKPKPVVTEVVEPVTLDDSPAPAAPPKPPAPFDIAAAMKSLVKEESATQSFDMANQRVRWVDKDELAAAEKARDAEFAPGIQALEPILHPREKERYKDILNDAGSPADRWKARNGRGIH